jgi:hypothetical protein
MVIQKIMKPTTGMSTSSTIANGIDDYRGIIDLQYSFDLKALPIPRMLDR